MSIGYQCGKCGYEPDPYELQNGVCPQCNPNTVTSPRKQLAEAKARVKKLELALTELRGFAERNEQRAKKAAEAAEKDPARHGDDDYARAQARDTYTAAEARFHDAVRFRQVIVERVREALAP